MVNLKAYHGLRPVPADVQPNRDGIGFCDLWENINNLHFDYWLLFYYNRILQVLFVDIFNSNISMITYF